MNDPAIKVALYHALQEIFPEETPAPTAISSIELHAETHQFAVYTADSNVILLTPPLPRITNLLNR